ncbi:MAG TPA: glycoside hydrolase family 15 protein [archaeon]|nr:glycoside hydrolase family 15 protein [archaeon]
MTRQIILSNSRLHVGISPNSDIEDVYYPYVGYADHVHRISLGAYADGKTSWLRDGWEIKQSYLENSLIGVTEANSSSMQLKISSTDFVDHGSDIFWRKIAVQNMSRVTRDIRLFSYHDLHIDENPLGDTAMLDPHLKAIVHYKNDFYFAFCSNPAFNQFATGRKEWMGLEGTWRDADDGSLSGNTVSNGPVDSCTGWNLSAVHSGESRSVQTFMAVGRSFTDIERLRLVAMRQTADQAIKQTMRYWQNWLAHGQDDNLATFPSKVHEVYNRSLLILRSMCSENGAIIASSDSEIQHIGGDTYDYVWPRDGSWCVIALNLCGYHEITRRFFKFIFNVKTEKGYFLHKYYPTGMFGSTWQPVPFIQIDQTGIVLHALWNFHQTTGDIEFIAQQWPHIQKIGTFLLQWRDKVTKLPHPSWDLWEEREATTTYSSAAVYAGLRAGAKLASLVGLDNYASRFNDAANEVREGILNYLYDQGLGRFLRSVNPRDDTVDASLVAVNTLGVLPIDDPRFAGTMKAVEEHLWLPGRIGGIARYPDDKYLRVSPELIGNPWILTTLYLAMCYVEANALAKAKKMIEWATERASPTGLLAEQVNAFDGGSVGVLPLGWSHASYIIAVQKFAAKLASRGLVWDSKD